MGQFCGGCVRRRWRPRNCPTTPPRSPIMSGNRPIGTSDEGKRSSLDRLSGIKLGFGNYILIPFLSLSQLPKLFLSDVAGNVRHVDLRVSTYLNLWCSYTCEKNSANTCCRYFQGTFTSPTGRPDSRLGGRSFPEFFDHARTVMKKYVPPKI